MPEFSRAARVGAMAIVLAIAVMVGYRFISRATGTSGGYMVYAYLPDMTGVAPQSRVMISGIQVGVVDRIWLDQGRARVDIKMMPGVKLYDNAAIGKRATSLIGEYYVVLIPGTPDQRQLEDGDEIKNLLEEPSIQSLQGQIAEILKDVKAVTNSLKNTVGSDKGQDNIDKILKNLAETTEQLNATVKENREAVKGTLANVNAITGDAKPQISKILENIKAVTDDVRGFTGKGDPAAGGAPGEIRKTLERIDRASASLESTLGHADNIAARIDRGEGTVGRLTKDETLINEVETVVQDVGDLVGGIGRVQTVVGLRTDYNFLANTVKSYVELRLQPSVDKYYMIQLVNDPRGKTSIEQTTVDTTNPNDPPSYRETRVTTTNDFRISFQFAKRLGPFTGRFGILESTGGIGLDLHLIDDRFELRQDLFGFGEQLAPRWRITLGYEFLSMLWLLGGVDDIITNDRRDYFVGLQLRFNDEDLKTILPFVPAGGL
ncbi:MAG: MCE family protein [Polyangiaceae bacterium]|nr:MCE family protein [Polyangiaceae bacterium]MBK8942842.1 MCE family protein [Polyangiaceae bacterium]